MISKNNQYWATGINLYWADFAQRDLGGDKQPGWGGSVEFLDDGFCDDDADQGRVSTQGRLHTRYAVADGDTVTGLRAVMDALLADAERLGIEWRNSAGLPCLYYEGDGENPEMPPPDGWRELLAREAQRIGWSSPYRLAAAE